MKDTVKEDLPYNTSFVVFDPFLRRSQVLLTSITYLTLAKKKLKQNKINHFFQIAFK